MLDLHWDSPKLPWGMQRICFEDYQYAFQETLCPVTLATKSLYIIQVFIFIPLIHSAPFLRFWHILLYTIFFMYILPSKIFFLSLMTLLLGISLLFLNSAVKGLIWDLSNVLSNVYSFHTMEFSMKHKYKLAHIYQQSFKPCCYCLIKVEA